VGPNPVSASVAAAAAASAPKEGESATIKNRPVYKTKPDLPNSKEGTSGTPVSLSANYFKLIRSPEFEFNLYRVDFEPEFDLVALRKRFIYDQRELFGGYLFDGKNMLYLTRRLKKEEMKFECESREGDKHTMIVKNTGTRIEMTDGMAMQILNIILRRTMDGLKMQEVGRNLYDPQSKASDKRFSV
jgi:aubergine